MLSERPSRGPVRGNGDRDRDHEREHVRKVETYVRRIERRFNALRESGFYISPRDFALLLDWHERGVPADLVIAALEEVFARAAARSQVRKIQSILYCRRAVEEAWEERRTALLGPPPGADTRGVTSRGAFQIEEILEHLARAARETVAAAPAADPGEDAGRSYRSVLLGTAERLAELQQEIRSGQRKDLESLEDELVALEARVLEHAAPALTPEARDALQKQTEAALAGFTSRMSERTRKATLHRALDASIRRTLGLPRYSLFTLVR